MSGHEPDAVRLGAVRRRFQRSIVARAGQEPRSSKAHCKRSTRKCPERVGGSWYLFGMDVSNGRLGRVRHVDGSRVYANVAGGLAWFDWSEADSLSRGQVILMPEEGPPEIVDDELWVAGSDTGSVRAVTDEVALIEVDGKLRSFAHRSGQPWRTGQTVLIEDDGTPVRRFLTIQLTASGSERVVSLMSKVCSRGQISTLLSKTLAGTRISCAGPVSWLMQLWISTAVTAPLERSPSRVCSSQGQQEPVRRFSLKRSPTTRKRISTTSVAPN